MNSPIVKLVRIISGGQTGADRAGLDFAIEHDIPHGGWCPKGRRAEDGQVPDRYNVKEMPTSGYPPRTEQNVVDSDGTMIVTKSGKMTTGSALTEKLARKHKKPCLHVALEEMEKAGAPATGLLVAEWLAKNDIRVLNVAGSRESTTPGIHDVTVRLLEWTICPLEI